MSFMSTFKIILNSDINKTHGVLHTEGEGGSRRQIMSMFSYCTLLPPWEVSVHMSKN